MYEKEEEVEEAVFTPDVFTEEPNHFKMICLQDITQGLLFTTVIDKLTKV